MKPAPLRIRVVSALALAPMTVRELARCLNAGRRAVWQALQDAEDVRRYRIPGRRNGHPEHVYRIG